MTEEEGLRRMPPAQLAISAGGTYNLKRLLPVLLHNAPGFGGVNGPAELAAAPQVQALGHFCQVGS